jgi:hypothetical protein
MSVPGHKNHVNTINLRERADIGFRVHKREKE